MMKEVNESLANNSNKYKNQRYPPIETKAKCLKIEEEKKDLQNWTMDRRNSKITILDHSFTEWFSLNNWANSSFVVLVLR